MWQTARDYIHSFIHSFSVIKSQRENNPGKLTKRNFTYKRSNIAMKYCKKLVFRVRDPISVQRGRQAAGSFINA
jgi:hypothetical protein